jgi:hypothetical protein
MARMERPTFLALEQKVFHVLKMGIFPKQVLFITKHTLSCLIAQIFKLFLKRFYWINKEKINT